MSFTTLGTFFENHFAVTNTEPEYLADTELWNVSNALPSSLHHLTDSFAITPLKPKDTRTDKTKDTTNIKTIKMCKIQEPVSNDVPEEFNDQDCHGLPQVLTPKADGSLTPPPSCLHPRVHALFTGIVHHWTSMQRHLSSILPNRGASTTTTANMLTDPQESPKMPDETKPPTQKVEYDELIFMQKACSTKNYEYEVIYPSKKA